MQKKEYIFFDLDGTLTDPIEGITKGVAYALERFGIHVEDHLTLKNFIGPPLRVSFMKYYGFTEEQAVEATEKYREYFEETGMFQNGVFEGIPQMLERLSQKGKKLVLATSKPIFYARQIMEKYDLAKYFTDMHGSEMDGIRDAKDEVIAYAMELNQITDPSIAVMVGDREHDICGAKKCGMESVGVLFGYGTRAELQACGADEIVEDVKTLEGFLMTL